MPSVPAQRPATSLGIWLRFDDLKKRGIVTSWQQLRRMQDRDGFPAGVMLSPNVRAFPEDKVQTWLNSRPTATKRREERCDYPHANNSAPELKAK